MRRSWLRGELLLAAFVLIATVVLVQQERASVQRAQAVPVLPPVVGLREPPGFRGDAWGLPDDPLLGFVEVPAGSFLIGSDPTFDAAAYPNERWSPEAFQGEVTLPGFHIQRFPVTVAQYRTFVEATGHNAPAEAFLAPADHPVTAVSWPDALAYARWLDAELRSSSSTPPELARRLAEGARVTLPNEAEWEKAARGTDGRIFPWGNEPRSDRANYQGTGTSPVGSFPCPECPYGLRDMSGNVWEWTTSPFHDYPWDPSERPRDEEGDALFVMRGGAFSESAQNVRAAVRGGADPGARRPFLGFRVVIAER